MAESAATPETVVSPVPQWTPPARATPVTASDTAKPAAAPAPAPEHANSAAARVQAARPLPDAERRVHATAPIKEVRAAPTLPRGDHSFRLVIGAGVALILMALGVFAYMSSQQNLAKAQAEHKAAEMSQQIAAEQAARAEAERKSAELARQLAAKTAQAAAQQAPAQTASPDASPNAAAPASDPATLPIAAQPASPMAELVAKYPTASALPHIHAMLVASNKNDDSGIDLAAQKISEFPAPPRGDRKQARRLNDVGIAQLGRGEIAAAIDSFSRAALTDPSDPEIVGNLAHAYFKQSSYDLATQAVTLSLTLTPRRASSWGTLALVSAKGNPKEPAVAVAAYQNAYRFAGSQDKAREYLQKLATEDDDSSIRRLAETVLASLPSLRSHGTDAARSVGR